MRTVLVRKHYCARCGKPGSADRMVFSRHTGNRYCADITLCERRSKRVKR